MRNANELRALLNTMRSLSMRFLVQRRFGTHAADVLLLGAVYIGQVEGKPMTAHKLAQYAGMPRGTAVRRLQRLEAMGLVRREDGGGWTLTAKALRRIEAAGRM